VLSQRSAQSQLREVVAAARGSNILRMISAGRADYTLEFDYILTYNQLRYPQLLKAPTLKSLPIVNTHSQVAGICQHRLPAHRMGA
jgi:hypothetical protein